MLHRHKKIIAVALCSALAFQQSVFAANPGFTYVDGIKVHKNVKDLALDSNGALQGVMVTPNGKPVADANVVIGSKGQILGKTATNAEGCYQFKGLKPGTYQVATLAGVQTYRVWAEGSEPSDSVKGSVFVTDGKDIPRGQNEESRLVQLLKNPLVWAIAIAAAIILPLVLDDDAS